MILLFKAHAKAKIMRSITKLHDTGSVVFMQQWCDIYATVHG